MRECFGEGVLLARDVVVYGSHWCRRLDDQVTQSAAVSRYPRMQRFCLRSMPLWLTPRDRVDRWAAGHWSATWPTNITRESAEMAKMV